MIYLFPKKNLNSGITLNNLSVCCCECSDDIFKLKLPKLIENILTVTPKTVDTLIDSSLNNNTDNLYKFEKKYKSNDYVTNSPDIKKVRSKSIKTKRNNSNVILSKEMLVDNQDDALDSNSLNLSIVKSRKNTYKNKNKIKENDVARKGNTKSLFSKDKDIKNLSLNQNQLIKEVIISRPLTVQDLSSEINVPEAEIITYLFLNKGIAATINQLLDVDIAREVAINYGIVVLDSEVIDDYVLGSLKSVNYSDGSTRSPIITILGHVDHGKTSLLDAILKTNLVSRESGGITQSISAYEMTWKHESNSYDLIFIDTPGHQSFKTMRLRGSTITDIALLVIAINDGLKPQTIEAIDYIQKLSINFIIVITKVDKTDQNIDHILNELIKYDITTEQWGGVTPIVQVSALNSRNVETLLSKICNLSNAKNFTANYSKLARGTIIDSYLDKQQGPIANIIVQDGMLKVGNVIASGNLYGKVKKIVNLSSKVVSSAEPSSIIKVLAFSSIPKAGLSFEAFVSEKQAKHFCLGYSKETNIVNLLQSSNNRIISNSDLKQLNLIIKADKLGSLEAIIDLLSTISQLKVQLCIISASLNLISNSDLNLAVNTSSIIVAFNTSPIADISNNIKKYNLVFQNFNVIYDLLDYVKSAMLNLIEPEYDKVFIGSATVRTVFKINKGFVAGCYVYEGKLVKMSYISVYRNNQLVYEGDLKSLKRVKDDVDEVLVENECGIMCDYILWEKNDQISAYSLIPKQKSL
uniref:Translation initiation factor IF-2, chloroplastic n=1 Tax=Chondria sp. (in: red algae) TaxID=1982705 RepID=A0A1Z1ME81_9FLOR|nr:translation initiation factor 2 [Chondria sp. (in: red algae)]